ncbi:MAG: DUF5309 domain-containing protein [Alphaproteobacteria bacterium]
MTQPTNTFDSYDAIGNREDLTDVIYNISPTDTPFLSMCATTKASNTLHEWQTDSYANADADNARIEGDEASAASISGTTRAYNYTQISDKVVVVSGTQEALGKAGRKSEIGYQVAKAGKELKRDIESILLGNQGAVAGDSSTPRKLRSLESWYATNTSRGAGGADGDAVSAATDGTERAFTETVLKDCLQNTFLAGGNPDYIMVGPFNKQVFSTFTGGATKFEPVKDKTVTAAVDVYISDFGELKVIANRFQRDESCHIIQKDMWGVAYLQNFSTTELASTGNHKRKQILAEYTLEARNEASGGIIADLTTS